MICKFIGKNGSLGLKNGKIYEVNINKQGEKISAYIEKTYDTGVVCIYDSEQLFWDNWEIKQEKKLSKKTIIQTIALRKYKTKIIEESLKKYSDDSYLVWYKDGTAEEAYSKANLISILKNDHIKPIRYIFDMNDRIIIDRDVKININNLRGE